jgi:hypothetical protein
VPQCVTWALSDVAQSALLSSFEIRGPSLASRILTFTSVGDGVSLNFFPIQVR